MILLSKRSMYVILTDDFLLYKNKHLCKYYLGAGDMIYFYFVSSGDEEVASKRSKIICRIEE
jgi:hypothetical protein